MATETDLAKAVMLELSVLPAGTDPSAEEGQDITTRYVQRLEMLLDEDYADWSANSIPTAAMPGLVRVIAYECGPMFGVARTSMHDSDGRSWEENGLMMLRRYMRKKPTYETVKADYF